MNINHAYIALKRRLKGVQPDFPNDDPVTSALFARAHVLFKLSENEKWWRDHAAQIKHRKYRLRKRFRPGWKPSWIGTDLNPELVDDAQRHSVFSFELILRYYILIKA